ncbi:MAG: hypothetical protein RIB61_01370 [Roseicyclus sp.]
MSEILIYHYIIHLRIRAIATAASAQLPAANEKAAPFAERRFPTEARLAAGLSITSFRFPV